jgi:cytochrome oxidase Cu insertion factor (SCO1/SenC/PrrC family)
METLTAAVILLTILVVFGLVLVLGLVRRVRSLSDEVHQLGTAHPGAVESPLIGTTVADFEVTSVTGETLSHRWLSGADTVVAFVTYGCPSCKVHLATLREHAQQAGHAGRTLIVATRAPDEESELDALLAAVGDAPVVVEEEFSGPVQQVFRVERYPSFYAVDVRGVVRASNSSLSVLLARLRSERLLTTGS